METVDKYSKMVWIFATFLQSICHDKHTHLNSLVIASYDIAKLNYLSNETSWDTVSYLVPTILVVKYSTGLSKISVFHERLPFLGAEMLKMTYFTMPIK